MVTKETALASTESNSVNSFISDAIREKLPVETMERLFALRKEFLAEQAKSAYVQAMAIFQSEVPVIKKTKKVHDKSGKLRYLYAPIDLIVQQIQKPLGKAQLSYRFETSNDNVKMSVTCIVTHAQGHKESSSFDIPIDKEAYMTAPQKVASALTFAKRYTLCNALGISTGDEDTDATDVNKDKDLPKSTKAQIVIQLRTLGKKVNTPEEVRKAVQALTQLDCTEENFEEISARLSIMIEERNENPEVR